MIVEKVPSCDLRSNQEPGSQSTAQRNHGNVSSFEALVKVVARVVCRILDFADLGTLLSRYVRHARGLHLVLVHEF